MTRWWCAALVVAGCGSSGGNPSDAPLAADAPGSVDAASRPTEDLATGLVEPATLTVDATHVYFGQAGTDISRVPLAGGTVEPLATDQAGPGRLDATTSLLCWVATGHHANDFLDGSIHCGAKTGGDTQLAPAYMPTSLVVDDGTVYWAEGDGGQVQRIEIDGTGQLSLDASGTFKTSLALTATALIWTSSGELDDVVALDRITGTPTTISSAEYAADSVVVIGADLYWTAHVPGGSDFGMIRVSHAGAAAVDLVAGEYGPSLMVGDGGWLYWLTGDGIRRLDLAGGNPETFIDGRGTISGLALDAGHVYWSELDRGAIVRAAR